MGRERVKGQAWEGKQRQERQRTEGRVGRRGRGDVSGFPLSQMAEVKRKRLIRYTLHIVSTICCSASLCSALPVTSSPLLCDLGHYMVATGERRGTRERLEGRETVGVRSTGKWGSRGGKREAK